MTMIKAAPSNTPLTAPTDATVRERKPYHPPHIEDYGSVNELTRSAVSNAYEYDGIFYYTTSAD